MEIKLDKIKENWRLFFTNKKAMLTFFVALSVFLIQMIFLSAFQSFIELRPGFAFDDPIMSHFQVYELHWVIFIAIYSAHILAIILALKSPGILFKLLLGYLFVYFFRIFAMYLIPLDPPIGIISLRDPFLEWFASGAVINKDLFYSGHTATLFMVFLMTQNKLAKSYIFIALCVVVVSILLQRVHYSIDVYAAFFFSYTAYRVATFFSRKIWKFNS